MISTLAMWPQLLRCACDFASGQHPFCEWELHSHFNIISCYLFINSCNFWILVPLSAFMLLANDTLLSFIYLSLYAFTHAFRWLEGWDGASVWKIWGGASYWICNVTHMTLSIIAVDPCPCLVWGYTMFGAPNVCSYTMLPTWPCPLFMWAHAPP